MQPHTHIVHVSKNPNKDHYFNSTTKCGKDFSTLLKPLKVDNTDLERRTKQVRFSYIIMFAVRRYLQGCLQSNLNISSQKEDKPEEKNILSHCFRWQKCEVV